jgi:hypothetical protein
MGDVDRRYDPGSVEQDEEEIPTAEDVEVRGEENNVPAPMIAPIVPVVAAPF